MKKSDKDKELEIIFNEFIENMVIPTEEENLELMDGSLKLMHQRTDCKYLCYCMSCPNRIRLMEDLNDISASILSDIYGD